MYRSRREIDPPIAQTAVEFSQMITSSQFTIYFKGKVEVGCDVGVSFFGCDDEYTLKCRKYSFWWYVIYGVPSQFYQLWTIFVRFGRHILSVIHCPLTAKYEELYTAVLAKIHEHVPQLIPINGMSDWEKGARNAIKG